MKNAIPPIITSILLLAFSVIWAFFLLIALNGFSESAGTRALIVYAIWAILTIVLFSAGSGFTMRFIKSKTGSINPWIITISVIVACSVFGSVGVALGSFVTLLVAGL